MSKPKVVTELLRCLACDSPSHLKPVLDLGHQALANCLLSDPTDQYHVYPLHMMRCAQCGHGQLSHAVPPSTLYTDYAYASSTSNTLRDYFSWFADECVNMLPPGASVLEIACNDGSLLKELHARGLFTFGIDPAANLTKIATSKHKLRVNTAMWPCKLPVGPYAAYDMVIGLNVLAHGPDPLAFLQGVRRVLSPSGVCVIQTSQAHQLERGEFDTIYHEHYSYFTVSSMTWLAARAGLCVRMVREVSVHGGSLAFVLSRVSHDPCLETAYFLKEGQFAVQGEIPKTGSAEDYKSFVRKAEDTLTTVRNTILRMRAEGCRIVLIGAAAKAVVFMNSLHCTVDNVYDEAPLKIGKWIPELKESSAVGLQIQDLKEIAHIDGPVLAILGAWNYKTELEEKVIKLRTKNITRFLTYFPEILEWTYIPSASVKI